MPDDERLVEVPEVVESDSPAQPIRSHELPQLLHNVLQQLGVLLPRPFVEPNGEPDKRRVEFVEEEQLLSVKGFEHQLPNVPEEHLLRKVHDENKTSP